MRYARATPDVAARGDPVRGRGTRLQEHTESIPKPLVEIGGRPILWHVIQIYLAQGFRRFLLLTGYLGDQVERFVARRALARRGRDPVPGHRCRHPDGRSAAPRRRRARREPVLPRPMRTVSPTSTSTRCCASTPTHGARRDDDRGPARAPVRRRRASTATGSCAASSRSPAASTGSTAASSASSPACSTCSGPTASSSASRWSAWPPRGELRAFRHEGFWDCMDTYKDAVALNDLWARAGAVEAVGIGPCPRARYKVERVDKDVRAFKMGLDQAQEGRRRPAARPAFHEADAGDLGRSARGRGRPTGNPGLRWRSRRPATPGGPRTTSSARSPKAPARAPTPTRSRPCSTRATGPAAWHC